MLRRPLPANQRLPTEAPLFNVQEHHLYNLLKVFNSQLILFQESSHRDLMNSLVLLSQFPNGEGWNLLILKVEETQARISFLNYFYKLLSQRLVVFWSSSESVSHMPIGIQHKFIIRYNETQPQIDNFLHQIFQTTSEIKRSDSHTISGLIDKLIADSSELCIQYHLQTKPIYTFLGVTNSKQMEHFMLHQAPQEYSML